MLLIQLLACVKAKDVVWTSLATDEVAADAAAELLTLGAYQSDDGAVLDALHATGSWTRMEVGGAFGEIADQPKVESLNPDICSVAVNSQSDTSAVVTLTYLAQGSTDVIVTDASGLVLDWQPVEVRDPMDAVLVPYDVLAVGEYEALEQLVVLPGSEATVALSWQSGLGSNLSGGGLLSVAVDGVGMASALNTSLEGNSFEAFDLVIDAGAEAGTTGAVTLSAGDVAVKTVDVVVYDPADITEVILTTNLRPAASAAAGDTGGAIDGNAVGERGVIRADVLAGETSLLGVPVVWYQDGTEVGVGSFVVISGKGGEELHEITACWDELCEAEAVYGTVEGVGDSVSEEKFCSCAHTGARGWGAATLLLAAVGLVRRRRG